MTGWSILAAGSDCQDPPRPRSPLRAQACPATGGTMTIALEALTMLFDNGTLPKLNFRSDLGVR
jgi:hypothetical protein